MKRILAAVLVLTPCLAIAQEAPAALVLACSADGSRETSSRQYEWTRRPDGTHGYDLKQRHSSHDVTTRYEFEIEGTAGRFRLPEDGPGLLSRSSEGGWSQVRGLKVGEDVIEGRIGLLGATRFRIDRRTGAFSVGGDKGECQKMPTERKF